MTALDTADDVRLGSTPVDRVYLGADEVWSSAPPPFSPADLAGLAIWLDASQLGLADGANVSPWPNLANGSLPGTVVGTPPPKVRANALNGKPVVGFLHTDGRIAMSGTGVNAEWTVVYVARMSTSFAAFTANGRILTAIYTGAGTPNLLLGWWGGYQDVMYDNGFGVPDVKIAATTDWKLYSADGSAGSPTRLLSDGTLLSTVSTPQGWIGTFGLNGIIITGDDERCDCDVAELVFYNRKLSDADRQTVEAYLRGKWGIS